TSQVIEDAKITTPPRQDPNTTGEDDVPRIGQMQLSISPRVSERKTQVRRYLCGYAKAAAVRHGVAAALRGEPDAGVLLVLLQTHPETVRAAARAKPER
ncbi:hypothetical protein, partial [Micromonospora aurantiaca (nom. illeg.)]|uniref:hypothetical protein n=1 Tax=Micromonospora aurantiaca (nom. illeg.) TaxID=47850 RepID=UPI001CA454DA